MAQHFLRIGTSLLLLVFAFSAQSQNSTNLDSVIVRENRIQTPLSRYNRNLQILDRATIQALPVKSVNELLSYVAGVDLRQRGPWGAQADVSIDGGTFDQVLVLINGVKVTDAQTGHNLLNLPIAINSIERIEVLRGPAARTYGANALAGAINIVTHLPKKDEVLAQAYTGSSFKTDTASGTTYYSWGAQASAGIARKNQSHNISIGHDQGSGYRYNTAYDAYRAFYQNKLALNNRNAIEAMGGYVSNKFGAGLFYAAPSDKEATERVETALGSIAFTHTGERFRITPRVSYRYNKDDYIYVRQKPSVYHNIHEANTVSGEVNGSYQLSKGTLGMGVEARYEGLRSTNLGVRNRQNFGAYAEYKHLFSSRFDASAGIYANYNSDYSWQFYPGFDAGYKILPALKLVVSAGSGQRLPTYTDLYYKGPTNIGNTLLKPENAWYAEGGVQYRKEMLNAQASYGYRRISYFIDWTRLALADPWQPQNFQTVTTKVLTVQGDYDFRKAFTRPEKFQLHMRASYTHLKPAIEAPTERLSKYAIEALRHQAIASANALCWSRFSLMGTARYQQRINAGNYTVLDARMGWQTKRLLYYVEGNNLTNTSYRELAAVPLPGRWMAAGIRFSSGGF